MSESTFLWGSVTQASPLRIRLDGDSAAIPATPATLVGALAVGDRVRCELNDNRLIVHGRYGGPAADALLAARNRNRVRNGRGRTNQRGWVTGTTIPAGGYFLDGWRTSQKIINMIKNPSMVGGTGLTAANCTIDGNDTSWAAHGSNSINLYSPTNEDSYAIVESVAGPSHGVKAGKTYVLSATGNVKVALSGATIAGAPGRERTLTVFYQTNSGAFVELQTGQVPNVINTPTRVSVEFTLPDGMTNFFIRAYLGRGAGQIRWDAFRLCEKVQYANNIPLTDYVDGSFTGRSWTGSANASTTADTATATSVAFTASPQGQPLTISSGGGIETPIERADVPVGAAVASWEGTATARVYNRRELGALPAFAAAPIAVTLDGLDDVVVEFAAVGGTKTVDKVQLEAGSVPTPYEVRPVGEELAHCRRSLRRQPGGQGLSGGGSNGSIAIFRAAFDVPMRVTPLVIPVGSLTVSDDWQADWTAASPVLYENKMNAHGGRFHLNGWSGIPQGRFTGPTGTGTGYIDFDAEM